MAELRKFVARHAAQEPFFVGVDLGGTNVKAGVVDDLGRPMSWLTLPTNSSAGPEDAVRRMGLAVKQATIDAGLQAAHIARVGLGSPGTMDIPTGMLLEPPNLVGWENFPIRARLEVHCGHEVTLANDANAAAYGEYWVGSGQKLTSMVLFTLGTGVGGGIIIGDLSVDGHHSTGSECGHIIIDISPQARLCPCGQPGHLEAYCSATAVLKRTEEALAQGRPTSLRRRLADGSALTTVLLAEEAEAGDPLADEIIVETAHYFGVGVTSLMHVIDPEGVVIGGAMTFGGNDTPLGRKFLAEVRAEVRRRAFPVLAAQTSIEYARLGGDAGFIGAAGLARLEHRRRHRM
ncbi:MAG: glucokinase [Pirellula sp.]|nr:glucokinase [Pirellula sp.]